MENVSGAYDINVNVNVTNLTNSNSELLLNIFSITNSIKEVDEINSLIKGNWENTNEESDISSSMTKINECVVKINDIIIPTLSKFTDTMNTLIIAHQTTAEKIVEIDAA
ncbi:MAG: hypothetical protein ACLUFU_03010 [Bacilli bacterium]